jgi:hypothetical protein
VDAIETGKDWNTFVEREMIENEKETIGEKKSDRGDIRKAGLRKR